MIRDLVESTRSYRRFKQNEKIGEDVLKDLVDLARQTASAANQQPLKYVLSCEAERNALIFGQLAWAGALKDWDGPAEGERPAAYLIVLGDTTIVKSFGVDPGIAAQTIVLAAREKGYGACMIASVKKDPLRKDLKIPDKFEILLVIALGVPGEKVVLEDSSKIGQVTYYRDQDSTHHVPKRPLDEVIVKVQP